MTCMNLFIFPTKEESFGLVLPEAALTSGCFCVLNRSLPNQMRMSGFNALYFDFGSHAHLHKVYEEKYFTDIAKIILGRIMQNQSIL